MTRLFVVTLGIVGLGVAPLLAATVKPEVRERGEMVCLGDAMRLCGQFIPNEDKITACMQRRRAEISNADCRATIDGDPQ